MGNIGSNGHSRRRHGNHNTHPHPPPSQPPQPDISGNRYVYGGGGSGGGGGTTPYPSQYPNTNPPQYNQYYGYYQQPPGPMPVPMQNPYDYHHHGGGGNPHVNPAHGNWGGGQFPGPPGPQFATPYIEHQKATTIRNNVNLKKETLRVEPDEENPGYFLISFTFDATVAGSITIMFFAKEGEDCNLMPTKEPLLEPITVSFQQGLGQKFRQPSGTGIDFSMFEETELLKEGDMEVFPLAVKAEALPLDQNGSEGGNQIPGNVSSQITEAVFEKERGGYQVRVMKQILWVNGSRYELQEIYGIGSAVESELDESDQGKDCVICLSEPRDTTVLPCRHMCMCSACAKVLRFQTDRCPICRQPVERLLEIKVNNRPED